MSEPYPIGPFYAEDRMSLALGFDTGEHSSTTATVFAPGDAVSDLVGFESGEAPLIVIEGPLVAEDAASVATQFDSGEYRLVILEIESATDAAAVETTFESGCRWIW